MVQRASNTAITASGPPTSPASCLRVTSCRPKGTKNKSYTQHCLPAPLPSPQPWQQTQALCRLPPNLSSYTAACTHSTATRLISQSCGYTLHRADPWCMLVCYAALPAGGAATSQHMSAQHARHFAASAHPVIQHASIDSLPKVGTHASLRVAEYHGMAGPIACRIDRQTCSCSCAC